MVQASSSEGFGKAENGGGIQAPAHRDRNRIRASQTASDGQLEVVSECFGVFLEGSEARTAAHVKVPVAPYHESPGGENRQMGGDEAGYSLKKRHLLGIPGFVQKELGEKVVVGPRGHLGMSKDCLDL